MSKQPRRVVKQDNVLYINFGRKGPAESSPAPRKAETNTALGREQLRNRNRTPDISAWFLRLISLYADAGRVQRGRDYYRTGHVLDIDVSAHAIRTSVRGSQHEPFQQQIRMPYRDSTLASQVVDFLLTSGTPLKKVREGVLPFELFELLVGGVDEEPAISCDCPDHAMCCKHIVAALHATADHFVANPVALLELRGLSALSLETALIEAGQTKATGAVQDEQSAADEAVDEAARAAQLQQRTEHFWNGTTLPPIPEPSIAPAIDDGDLQLLHKAMRQICYSTPEELRAVSDIEDLYYALTHSNTNERNP